MNVLTDDIFRVYWKFLFAAFGSAMLSSIYTLAEAAVAAYAVASLRRRTGV